MNTIGFIQNLHGQELLVILLVILLLFGGKKLPELARALGRSMQEFRKGREDKDDEADADTTAAKTNDTAKPPAEPPKA